MPDDTPLPAAETVRVTPPRRRPTLVWIIPLLAVALSLGLGIKALLERGPQITLQFARAEGLEANKTRLKYKDVDIGTVTDITLSPDRSSVQVKVQVNNSAKGLLVEDSRFWVVRPRVTVGGVSGLATLLSGVHIAIDPGQSGSDAREFVGLEEPPAITSDTRGSQFKLSSDTLVPSTSAPRSITDACRWAGSSATPCSPMAAASMCRFSWMPPTTASSAPIPASGTPAASMWPWTRTGSSSTCSPCSA